MAADTYHEYLKKKNDREINHSFKTKYDRVFPWQPLKRLLPCTDRAESTESSVKST